MNKLISVKESGLEDVLKVHIDEFKDSKIDRAFFEERYKNDDKVIIVAYYKEKPIGYIVGYDKFKDNKDSFYCWMAGVEKEYRRMGALTQLMNYQKKWAKDNGYKKLKIKTRNSRREMLYFLVNNGFNFTSVEEKEDINENRINLEILL